MRNVKRMGCSKSSHDMWQQCGLYMPTVNWSRFAIPNEAVWEWDLWGKMIIKGTPLFITGASTAAVRIPIQEQFVAFYTWREWFLSTSTLNEFVVNLWEVSRGCSHTQCCSSPVAVILKLLENRWLSNLNFSWTIFNSSQIFKRKLN